VAIGRIGRERREAIEPLLTRIADFADHLLSRQKAHQKDIAAGQVGHRRKRDDVEMSTLGDRLYRFDLGGEQRAEDQTDPFADD